MFPKISRHLFNLIARVGVVAKRTYIIPRRDATYDAVRCAMTEAIKLQMDESTVAEDLRDARTLVHQFDLIMRFNQEMTYIPSSKEQSLVDPGRDCAQCLCAV